MTIKYGATLASAMCVTGSLQTLLNSCHIYFFSGTVPATADAALSGNTALLTVDNGGTGGTWQNTSSNGVLTKTAAETWSGTVGTAGTATFFRICVGTDNGQGAAAAGNYRVQGAVGTDISADLILATTALAASSVITLSNAQLALPTT